MGITRPLLESPIVDDPGLCLVPAAKLLERRSQSPGVANSPELEALSEAKGDFAEQRRVLYQDRPDSVDPEAATAGISNGA